MIRKRLASALCIDVCMVQKLLTQVRISRQMVGLRLSRMLNLLMRLQHPGLKRLLSLLMRLHHLLWLELVTWLHLLLMRLHLWLKLLILGLWLELVTWLHLLLKLLLLNLLMRLRLMRLRLMTTTAIGMILRTMPLGHGRAGGMGKDDRSEQPSSVNARWRSDAWRSGHVMTPGKAG